MNAIKQILKMVAGLVIGVLLGLAIVAIGVVCFTDTTLPEFIGKFGTTKFTEALGAGLVAMLTFVVGLAFLVSIHELGHLGAGIMSGYKFVSFRIFNYTIIRLNGKLRVKKYAVPGTGGQCLLAPPDKTLETIPTRWYNIGGVVANLIVLGLLIPLLFIKGHPYLSVAVWILILTDVILIVFNGIPMKISGAGNDAYNAMSLRNNPVGKRGLVYALKSNALIQNGVRPKDMPDEWFDVPAKINYKDQLEVSIPMMAASRLIDQLEFTKAREAFEKLYQHKKEIVGLYVREIECELVFLRLITEDIDGAKELLTPQLRKYIEAYSRVMSSKERILCAMSLILDGDQPKAKEIYDNLVSRQSDYLLQGEVKSDLAIMSHILNKDFL